MASMVAGSRKWRSAVIIFSVSEIRRSGSAEIAGIDNASTGDGFAAFVEIKVIEIHCLQPALN